MVFDGLDQPLYPKIKVVTCYLTKPQYCYKQAFMFGFVNHGPQMLTASVLMVLFEPLGHDCDPRYLKLTIRHFSGLPGKPKIANLGYFAIIAKTVGSGYP